MAYRLFRIHPGIPGCLLRLRVYMFLFHFLFSSLLSWFGLVSLVWFRNSDWMDGMSNAAFRKTASRLCYLHLLRLIHFIYG